MALVYTKSIMVPFVISLFVYSVATPIISWLQSKLKIGRLNSTLIVGFLLLGIFALMVFLMTISLESFLNDAGLYKEKIISFVHQGGILFNKMGLKIDDRLFKTELNKLPILNWIRGITGGIISLVGNSALVMVFVIFLMAGESKSYDDKKLYAQIQSKISRYVVTKLLTSLSTAFIVWLILIISGVDLAFLFALLTFLLNFIPNIGSLLATILPLPILFLQHGPGARMILVLFLVGATQFLIGNILEPKMMGESMDLHPVTILIFLMFWGLVWGVPGMFLAVPITALLKIILSKIEGTKSLSELMAGRV